MYTLRKTFRFEASHRLAGHDGKCNRLHGHSWRMTVEIVSEDLHRDGPKKNMVMDFGDISGVVIPLVDEYLDHYHLNDTLKTENPTTEFVARWAYEILKPLIENLKAVIIHETCTSECRYEG